MSLNKEQYDRIMTEYAGIRDRHRHELEKRRIQAYARIPELQELDQRTPSLAVSCLKRRLAQSSAAGTAPAVQSPVSRQDPGPADVSPLESAARKHGGTGPVPASQASGASGESAETSFRETAARITRRRTDLLVSNGFPPDYLEMTWDCPDCRDTGYIGREKCHCLRRRETALLYDQSNLDTLAAGADFSLLSEKYYTGEDLQHFRSSLQTCRRFVEEFDRVYRNLYLYGTVGTGKTMLSVCAARALLEKGHSVLYFSAASLFDRLAESAFSGGSRDALRDFTRDLYGCDLLIIDDLGTEFTNAFVASQLFSCISERALNRRATIISTNLSLRELQSRYSDRVFSRITSTYEICKLTGRDIRLQKRRRARRI
ncbi:MAG: ATP-binding protein [Eubacteriales bacterium]|nr:ATP-binding protein [Eubacteriales bacterium]